MICQHSVDFLRHLTVVRAQPGLDVADSNSEFGRGECASQRRVCIAINNDAGRFLGHKHGFQRTQHGACHLAVRATLDSKVIFRLGDLQLIEKHARHVVIKVLPCVHKNFLDHVVCRQSPTQRGGLDELRPRADYGHEFHNWRLHAKAVCNTTVIVTRQGASVTLSGR